MFQTSVFPVPPGAERKVTLRYTQLCRKTDGMTDFLFPLSTAKYTSTPVEEIKFHVAIDSEQPIQKRLQPDAIGRNQAARRRTCGRQLHGEKRNPDVRFPAVLRRWQRLGRQPACSAIGTTETKTAISCCWPARKSRRPTLQRPKKTVVFVLDRSGSMSGEKIEQAKGAVKFVLNNLRKATCSTSSLSTARWKAGSRSCSDSTTKPARRPSASSKGSTPAAARISTGR